MFILERPYISDYLKRTVIDSGAPVLDTPAAREALAGSGVDLLGNKQFAALAAAPGARVYSNSENATAFIASGLNGSALPGMVARCKDKLVFRQRLADLYPDFAFRGVALDGLDAVDPADLPLPCVLKPAVGFFSLGVHVIETASDWEHAKAQVKRDAAAAGRQYPAEVLDTGRFIIEAVVPGEEYAVDVYFDDNGKAVVLNILGHMFASGKDVSDRVYFTSPSLIQEKLAPFTNALQALGERMEFSNFPAHVELREDENGHVAFIEANPMRFAGWCVTDLAHHAYGVNPYMYFLENKRPDWDAILPERKGKVYGVVVADLPADMDRTTIAAVDYEAFKAHFAKPLELRPVDYKAYNVFAFLFAEAAEGDMADLTSILPDDLMRFLQFK